MSLWIAVKYFFSFNKGSAINIISLITVLGIMFSTIAMVLVLSIFNGFEGLVTNLYQGYVPNLKIESSQGSFFLTDSVIDFNSQQTIIDKLKKYENDIIFSEVLEEEIILGYEKNNNDSTEFPKVFGRIKGVSENYNDVSNITNYILVESDKYKFLDRQHSNSVIMVGLNIANNLNLSVANTYQQANRQINLLKIWSIKTSSKKPELFYKNGFINSAIFSISPEFDNYIFSSIELVRNIFEKPNHCSYIEIKFKNNLNFNIQDMLQKELGDQFIVKNFKEQIPFLYKMVNTERIGVYLIFILILLVTMITLIGSLTIFILQKKEDMFILIALGSSVKKLKNIFMIWGQIIVVIGLFSGLIFGLIFSVLQNQFHFLTISGDFIIDYYPIEVRIIDLINIFIIVNIMGLVTSFLVSRRNVFYKNLINN